jgi:hypothetical protein
VQQGMRELVKERHRKVGLILSVWLSICWTDRS